ncbi:hypothetical protein D3C78_1338150 [compost metagenome]
MIAQVGTLRLASPDQMVGGWSVTALAADTQCLPVAGELAQVAVEAPLEAGGVAFDAHEVGILLRAAPVQRIAMVDALVGIQVEPGPLFHIPGGAERLQAAAFQLDQVLLQGLQPEGVGHLEVGRLAVRPRQVHPERVALALEMGGFHVVVQWRGVEVGQHRLRAGGLHGPLVMGALPGLEGPGMTALALLLVHPVRRGERFRCPPLRPPPGEADAAQQQERAEQQPQPAGRLR